MDKKERLSALIQHFSAGNKAQFAKMLGITPQTVSTWLARNTFDADKIFAFCEDVNGDWLLSGEGDMLSSPSSSQPQPSVHVERLLDDEAYKVPLVPISALGGSLNDFNLAVKRDDCETVISPIKDIDLAIKISGDSMEPEYPSGSTVLIKKINEHAFLEWGKVYVLSTCNGTVIKRLMPTDDPNTVLCESINPKYPPFVVSLEHVYGVYIVMMCMSFK